MKIVLCQFNSLKNLNKFTTPIQLSNDITISIFCKRIIRSDNVMIDIFLNNINNEDKIVSGKILTPNSCIFTPNSSNFNYIIECVNINNVNENITPDNLHNFYLQFTNYVEGESWNKEFNEYIKTLES